MAVRAVYLGIAEDVVAPLEPGLVGVGVARMGDVDERLRLLRRGQAAGNREALRHAAARLGEHAADDWEPNAVHCAYETETCNRIVLTHLRQSEVRVPVAHVADTAVQQGGRREPQSYVTRTVWVEVSKCRTFVMGIGKPSDPL